MKKEWLVKTLALGIIVLFIGVAIQPGISTNTFQEEKTDVDAKDYLFQTLIAISNNPDVKDLLKQNNQRLFTFDHNYKDIFLQLLFKKPRLLKSMLFTKPKMTYEYLDKSYNNGVELINILGEEESLKILESIKITNPDLLNELNNIIKNNKELSNRMSTLEIMNNEIKPDAPLELYPVFCFILFAILLTLIIIIEIPIYIILNTIAFIFKNSKYFDFICEILGSINIQILIGLAYATVYILLILGCFPYYPYKSVYITP
jgi:hypothetical protein